MNEMNVTPDREGRNFLLVPNVEDEAAKISVEKYVEFLLYYNEKVNLISRQITHEALNQLLSESFLLAGYVYNDVVLDAGSGNGILGIPIAITCRDKHVVLIEPRKKKSAFLIEAVGFLGLGNVEVAAVSVEEFINDLKKKSYGGRRKPAVSIVARGFPDFSVFCRYLKKGAVRETVLITSENKIEKNKIALETVRQKTYNVPLRNNLKILKLMQMENTAREKEKRV